MSRVFRHRRQKHGEHERHRRRRDAAAREHGVHRPFGAGAAAEREPNERHDREHQEDAHRQRELARVEELDDPAPLVDGREHEREDRQDLPALFVRDPGQADVQEQQVGEERDWTVLAR